MDAAAREGRGENTPGVAHAGLPGPVGDPDTAPSYEGPCPTPRITAFRTPSPRSAKIVANPLVSRVPEVGIEPTRELPHRILSQMATTLHDK